MVSGVNRGSLVLKLGASSITVARRVLCALQTDAWYIRIRADIHTAGAVHAGMQT